MGDLKHQKKLLKENILIKNAHLLVKSLSEEKLSKVLLFLLVKCKELQLLEEIIFIISENTIDMKKDITTSPYMFLHVLVLKKVILLLLANADLFLKLLDSMY